jgi:putative IMPACT (imprinted ancient) family translation regulator
MPRRPTAVATFKLREKASVFLTELHPAPDAETRAAILARLRKRDFDATHHCSAWREGVAGTAYGADDDGEPHGTAGMPMLRVLEGADLTDGLAVCIRWYGGTKLGSGGLVRAYTEGLQGALAEAEAQGLLETLRVLRSGELRVPLSLAHLPYAVLGAFPGAEPGEQRIEGPDAVLPFTLPPGPEAELDKLWNERSRGGRVEWLQ